MKKRVLIGICLLVAQCVLGSDRLLEILIPTGYVNDYAAIFTADQEALLESKLIEFEAKNSTEISVVTIKSLEGGEINDFATRLFEKWGIGKKDKDNGVLFLIAIEDRDVRIEVGYGLESQLNDSKVGRILDTSVIPHFKTGNYAQGMIDGTDAIIRNILVPVTQPVKNTSNDLFFIVIFIGIVVFMVIIVVASSNLKRASKNVPPKITERYIPPSYYIPSPPSQSSSTPRRTSSSSSSYKPSRPYKAPSFSGFKGFGGGMSGGGGASRKW